MQNAEGAAGTAIGSISLFIQLFDKCIQGFSLWQKGEKIGSDAVAFQVRLELQAARMKEWGLNWGIGDGQRGLYRSERRFQEYGDLAVRYIALIHHSLDVLNLDSTKSSAMISGARTSLAAASHIARVDELSDQDSAGRHVLLEKMRAIEGEANPIKNFGWSSEAAKFEEALRSIKGRIDELYSFFEPPRKDIAAHLVLNSCLASMDTDLLAKVQDNSNDDSLLRGLAFLKAATCSLDSRVSTLERINVRHKLRDLRETGEMDRRNNRSPGRFKNDEVLVEWKAVPSAPSATQSALTAVVIEQRVKEIGRLLKKDSKPKELRTLDCLGVVSKNAADNDDIQYGLIFKKPHPQVRTLWEVIQDPAAQLDLGQRFNISQMLVESVLFLHLSGWLHKGIRSDNVLFFGPHSPETKFDKPIIVGFEYSRENKANNETEGVLDDLEFNLYRHPEVQGLPEQASEKGKTTLVQLQRPSFSKRHDVYSLGVILLEIGLLAPAISILGKAKAEQAYGTHSAWRFTEWLLEVEVPRLGRLMGKTYQEATAQCLTGHYTNESASNSEIDLYIKVLRQLATCHA